MTRILPHDHDHRFAHPRGPRRPGARAARRRRHDADLPDLDLRAGGARAATRATSTRAPRTRPARRSSGTWRPSRARSTASRSARGSRRWTPCSSCCGAGDHVVCGENVYGGTHRLMERVYAQLGLCVHLRGHAGRGQRRARAITPATRMVYCETPTNPMMNLVDLAAVGDLTQARGLPVRRGQHLRDAVSSSGRSSSARTSCSTRPPST